MRARHTSRSPPLRSESCATAVSKPTSYQATPPRPPATTTNTPKPSPCKPPTSHYNHFPGISYIKSSADRERKLELWRSAHARANLQNSQSAKTSFCSATSNRQLQFNFLFEFPKLISRARQLRRALVTRFVHMSATVAAADVL